MSNGAQTSRLAVLVFTDVVGSSELKTRLGVLTYAKLLARHDAIFRELLSEFPSAEVLQDTGDGFFAAFRTVGDAVRFALRFQDAMHREPWGTSEPFQTRVGVHLGELAQVAGPAGGSPKVVGIAADLTQRVMSLACGAQILLTRAAFDEARQFVSEYPAVNGEPKRALRWMAHGDYLFHGAAEPVQVFEVGGDGIAPLSAPRDREKARRQRSEESKAEILGWRPAVGLAVPQASRWVLEKKLGEGTFGEVWLAHHAKLREKRVFKFCFDSQRLESFKRELTLFRLLRDALGDRPDIAKLYEVCLDHPPYFLESEYAPGGNLLEWAAAQGGLDRVPLETRLQIVAQVCDAVAAAHSVGVLHKDIKPSNILMHAGMNGEPPRPRLADFGIGLLTDKGQLAARHITEAGFTSMNTAAESSRSGTRIYMPPEAMVGRPFTIQGDIYALGILLYQMTIADLTRPLALGWERDVADELLREDIAACVDGDPARRVHSAAEIATRLRQLPARRAARVAEAHRRESARRRHQLFRVAQLVVAALVVVGALAVVGFFRERRLRVRAEQSERATQIARADALCDQGTAQHLAGKGKESRDAFQLARETYARFGLSTLLPDIGLYRSYRDYDPPILTIHGHDKGVMAVAWLRDGVRACSASLDGTASLWDVRTGEQLQRFVGHGDSVLCLAISPDEKQLLTGSADRTIRLWDLGSGSQLRKYDKKVAEVRGLAFAPDGRSAVSASKTGGAVQWWRLDRDEAEWSFRAKDEEFCAVAFSASGDRFLGTTYNGSIYVWDAQTRSHLVTLAGHVGVAMNAVFLADGRILSVGADRTVRLWELVAPKDHVVLPRGHTAGVRGVAAVPAVGGGSGAVREALSCALDGSLRLWDLQDQEVVRIFAGHAEGVAGVAVSPDGKRAISGGLEDGTVRVWDLGSNLETRTAQADAGVTSVACSADGRLIASGSWTGKVTVRDTATLHPLVTFEGLTAAIDCVRFLSDGNRLFAADNTGAARVWNVTTGQVLVTCPTQRAVPATRPVAIGNPEWRFSTVHPAGRFAITSGGDRRTFEVWPLSDPSDRRAVNVASVDDDITCLALSPDGGRVLVGGTSGVAHEWDVTSGQRIWSTKAVHPPARADRVAYSPDGKHILVGGHSTTIQLWKVGEALPAALFRGHTQSVMGLGFSRDQRVVYSSALDQTLRMWEAATGRDLDISAELKARSFDLAVLPGDGVLCSKGASLHIIEPSRAMRHMEFAARIPLLSGARATSVAPDASTLAALGEWYAFRGVDEWAVQLLQAARARGADVSSLILARCYWKMGRHADASREFQSAAQRREAPSSYIGLCVAAVDRRTQPSTAPSR